MRRLPIAVVHSFSTRAIPPRWNRVMLSTFTPSRTAITAWPSSCSNTDKNSMSAVASPNPQLTINGTAGVISVA